MTFLSGIPISSLQPTFVQVESLQVFLIGFPSLQTMRHILHPSSLLCPYCRLFPQYLRSRLPQQHLLYRVHLEHLLYILNLQRLQCMLFLRSLLVPCHWCCLSSTLFCPCTWMCFKAAFQKALPIKRPSHILALPAALKIRNPVSKSCHIRSITLAPPRSSYPRFPLGEFISSADSAALQSAHAMSSPPRRTSSRSKKGVSPPQDFNENYDPDSLLPRCPLGLLATKKRAL